MAAWTPQPADDLPDSLVLFDGVCALCVGWVNFVIARDPAARFRFTPIQSDAGAALAARFGVDAATPQTNVVISGGQAWFKLDTVMAIAASLPGWRWLAMLRLAPRPLRNLAYDLIAGNRYRMFGRYDACLIPAPAIRARFITDPAGLTGGARP